MSDERTTDIPEAELEKVIADYEFWGYEVVKRTNQGGGFWTIDVRKKTAAAKPAKAAAKKTDPADTSPGDSIIRDGAVKRLQGAAILDIAKRHVGQNYGPAVPDYTDPNWKGEFDCAEFASYCAYRAYGILFGTRPKGRATQIESYTGYWKEDSLANNATTAWQEALNTPGAFVLRYPPGSGEMGHVAICIGDGDGLYEAHSTALGVIKGTAKGRRWDVGVKLPGVVYAFEEVDSALLYRLVDPPQGYDPVVEKLQSALATKGYLGKRVVSGIFDAMTRDAVAEFQRAEGLLIDGEVGNSTGNKLLGKAQWNEIRSQAGAGKGPAIPGQELLTLARTVYGEARGETTIGQEAVAHVVLNRSRSGRYPNSISKVCLQPYQFSCWNVDDPNYPKIRSLTPGDNTPFDKCFTAAERVVSGKSKDPTAGALHYHSIKIDTPRWVTDSPKAQVTAEIGTHIFYVGIN